MTLHTITTKPYSTPLPAMHNALTHFITKAIAISKQEWKAKSKACSTFNRQYPHTKRHSNSIPKTTTHATT